MSEKLNASRRTRRNKPAHVAVKQAHQEMAIALLVLIIDDDQDTALGAAMRLRRAGHQVHLESNGIGGLARAIEQRPDVILLDLHMPTTDGLTTLRWLRDHTATAKIPVIAFSADESMRSQARLAGANHFVGKPYRVNQLVDDLPSIVTGLAIGRQQNRKLNIQITNQRLQQDVHRVQNSLGKMVAELKNVLRDSGDYHEIITRE